MDTKHRLGLQDALFGRYTLGVEIGRGAMAAVYHAHDCKLDRPVAVKILDSKLATESGTTRFLREIDIAANLQHPHILPLLDSGLSAGSLFYVMPYVDGPNLHQLMAQQDRLPIATALQITKEVASALACAHDQELAHLDVKPANVLLSNGHAMLADFGIARIIDVRRTDDHHTVTGTPGYMSPEQALGLGGVDGRSDIYSLACVAFEMLTGDTPFQITEPDQGFADQRLRMDPPSIREYRPELSESLDRLLRRALATYPEMRPATIHEFHQVLEGAWTPEVELLQNNKLLGAIETPRNTLGKIAGAALSLFGSHISH